MAEKMNTTGISGDDHQGLALMEPKMKPDIAVQQKGRRNADQRDDPAHSLVDGSERSLMLLEPSVMIL